MQAMSAKTALFVVLAAVGVAFCAFWYRQSRGKWTGWPTWKQFAIGAVTNFFDMLGIGSFATTTSLYKLGGFVDDADVPGTLNVGHMVPTFAQAFISIALVKVEMSTLVLMIGATAALSGSLWAAAPSAPTDQARVREGDGGEERDEAEHRGRSACHDPCPHQLTPARGAIARGAVYQRIEE